MRPRPGECISRARRASKDRLAGPRPPPASSARRGRDCRWRPLLLLLLPVFAKLLSAAPQTPSPSRPMRPRPGECIARARRASEDRLAGPRPPPASSARRSRCFFFFSILGIPLRGGIRTQATGVVTTPDNSIGSSNYSQHRDRE
jgi:hypothetical protein